MSDPVAEPGGAPGARWGPGGWAVVVAVFAAGFMNFPLRVVGADLDHLPGDGVDNRLNNYVLEHGYRWLCGRESAFWHAPMFFPAPRTTAYSDAHLGMLPFYAGLRAAGLSPERALQGWFLIPFALNYAACVWVVRRLGWGAAAAAAAGAVFAFAPPVAAQLTHCQLLPRFLVPPAALFAWRWLWAPTPARLLACAACVVGQVYLSVYIGYFLGLLLGIGFAVTSLRFRSRLPWRALLKAGPRGWALRSGVAAAALLALTPILIPYAQAHGPKPPETAREGFPPPAAWLAPADVSIHQAWARPLDPVPPTTPAAGEKRLFPGLVPLCAVLITAAAFAVRPPGCEPGAVAASAATTVLAVVALTTVVAGVVLYEPLLHLPGVDGMRVVGRVVLVLLFPAGLVVAVLVDAIVRAAGRAGPVVALAALGLVLADQWLIPSSGAGARDWAAARYPLATALARQERMRTAILAHPRPRLVYVFPGNRPPTDVAGRLHLQLDAMRASQDLGLPTVNGWSGYWPVGWAFFPGYRDLMSWLARSAVAPDRIAGLVVVGEPTGDDPDYERLMRASHPPVPLRE